MRQICSGGSAGRRFCSRDWTAADQPIVLLAESVWHIINGLPNISDGFPCRHYCLLPGGHVLASVSHPEASASKLFLICADDAATVHEIQTPYSDFGFSLSAQEVR